MDIHTYRQYFWEMRSKHDPFIGKTTKERQKIMISILKKEKYMNRYIWKYDFQKEFIKKLREGICISKNK